MSQSTKIGRAIAATLDAGAASRDDADAMSRFLWAALTAAGTLLQSPASPPSAMSPIPPTRLQTRWAALVK